MQSAQDYYPFGMQMPGRNYSAASYRYGFNGKENDNEVKGTGNQQDYGRRVYDTRLGRFLSVDPLQANYPWWSPYHFAGNSPILNVDLDGLETYNYNLLIDEKTGKSRLTLSSVEHGSLCDALTSQKVNYNGGIYNIHTEWNYSPWNGFAKVKALEGKTSAELAEYFKDKKTDSQQAEEEREKSEERYKMAGAIVFGGAALDKQQTKASSPTKSTNTQTTAANSGNNAAAKANSVAEEEANVVKAGPSLKTAGGKTINNSKWANQINPTALGKGFEVPVKANGYPDFSKYLYTGPVGRVGASTSLNTVNIQMTGTYTGDFAAANKAAGFSVTPTGYTWHHTETMGELQLIQTEAHQAARHSGSVQLYREQNNGKGYR